MASNLNTYYKQAPGLNVPVLYLDLDGTVRKSKTGDFVNTPDDVEILPDAVKQIEMFRERGWRIIAVSNQGGIAMGHLTENVCAEIMSVTQRLCDYAFDRMVWCPHYPRVKDPTMARCWCRKPRGGMVITATYELAKFTGELYTPHLGLFVGDRSEDQGCAASCGLDFMWAHDWRAGGYWVEGTPGLTLGTKWPGLTTE